MKRVRSLIAPVFSVLLVGAVLSFGSQPGDTVAVPMAPGVQPSVPYSIGIAQPELPSFVRDAEDLPPLLGTGESAAPIRPLLAAGVERAEEPPGEDTTVLARPSSVPTVEVPSALPTVQSGQTTLLAMPVNGRKTSRFGMRFHPIRKVWKLHSGLDLAVACGTPVGAAAPGTVVRAGWAGGNGIQVKIDHGKLGGRNVTTTYNHLSAIGVEVGQRVQTHQGVGRVGTTGFSTGCHLHFEVIANGKFTDPEPWLNGTAGVVDTGGMATSRPTGAAPEAAPSTPSIASSPSPSPSPSASTSAPGSPSASPTPSVTDGATPTPTPSPAPPSLTPPKPTVSLPPCIAPTPGVEPPAEPVPCASPTPSPDESPTPSPDESPTPGTPPPPETPTPPPDTPTPPSPPVPSGNPSSTSPAATPSAQDSAPAPTTASASATLSVTEAPLEESTPQG